MLTCGFTFLKRNSYIQQCLKCIHDSHKIYTTEILSNTQTFTLANTQTDDWMRLDEVDCRSMTSCGHVILSDELLERDNNLNIYSQTNKT